MNAAEAEVMAWIADDPEAVARSLVAAQAEIERLREELSKQTPYTLAKDRWKV